MESNEFIEIKSPLLKDLLKQFNYSYENIIFKNDNKLHAKDIVIGYNYENRLVCDRDLLNVNKKHKNIFKRWCQTSDILNVNVKMKSFMNQNGISKEPKYIAEELWNTLLEANSIINFSNNCIVYDELYDKKELIISEPISNIVQKLQGLIIRKIDISNNILSDEGLVIFINELVKHIELEEVNISNNMISDIGLRYLKNLSQCKNIKKIIIKRNYGPSNETLNELIGLPIKY